MEELKNFQPKNIIVRMPNWIGDLVMATPVLADLRRTYPQSYLTAMARSPVCELLKEDPNLNELFCFSKASHFSRHEERRSIIEKLRRGRYDLGILLTHSFSSVWWFWLGKVEERLGYDCNGRRWLLTHRVSLPQNLDEQHLVETYKTLLEPLGIPISQTLPKIYLQEKEIEKARTLLKQHGVSRHSVLVGINPGATYGSAKCWLPERFREVTARLLTDKNIFVLYFGDQQTAPLVKEISQGLSPRIVNLAGLTSLRELAATISLCDALLTNDSGPMHIAAALDVPIVALFGSTSAQVTGPCGTGKVIHKHVECSPCYQRSCPIDFRCMKRIEADEVYQEILLLLRRKKSKLTLV